MCDAKRREAEAYADMTAAETGLAQASDAWTRARNYLETQLRKDYLRSKYLRRGLTMGLTMMGGPLTWGGVGGGSITSPGLRSYLWSDDAWNQEVDSQLFGGLAEIDRIGSQAAQTWLDRLNEAKTRQSNWLDARLRAEERLAVLRADNPDVPDCGCE